ncbi:MAG: sulfatase [Flavisolibacter sp.]|nr:sulfatase [Flavisolibacter sp.]
MFRKIPFDWIKTLLCSFLLIGFLSSQAQQKRPNILWITCEDISPYIGAYGDKVVKTPNIDQLAKEGVRYTNVYTTAGVCAPSRAAIVTGMYQTSIGAQHMRTLSAGGASARKDSMIPPYSVVIPDYVRCFPEYLRKAGYYCTNNEKQDYQFEAPVTVWDENSPAASYRNRPADKPFFAVFNFAITHESQLFGRTDSLLVNGNDVTVPPYYPDTKTVRHDIARLFTNIERMDQQVGELISMLKEDGLYDSTIIFFYSDHGGALPWMKREVLERGTHIPFIIRFPGAENAGTVNDDLISGVDFAPTVLSLTGVPIPKYMQGQAFLGAQKAKTQRKYVFAGRDRMDTEYDRVRMVRDKRFRYLYNYMPEKPYYQNLTYRLSIPMMKEMLKLRDEGTLDSLPMAWFKKKPLEELYDVQNDPYELHNLAKDLKYKIKLEELRTAFQNWTKTVGDMGSIPEKEMIKQMWNGKNEPPVTATPEVIKTTGGVKISCSTKGASIGYRIEKESSRKQADLHKVQSWDFGMLNDRLKNGQPLPAAPVWQVYNGETIKLAPSDTLYVNAMRIGYKPSVVKYMNGQTIPDNQVKSTVRSQ